MDALCRLSAQDPTAPAREIVARFRIVQEWAEECLATRWDEVERLARTLVTAHRWRNY